MDGGKTRQQLDEGRRQVVQVVGVVDGDAGGAQQRLAAGGDRQHLRVPSSACYSVCYGDFASTRKGGFQKDWQGQQPDAACATRGSNQHVTLSASCLLPGRAAQHCKI